MLLPLIIQSRLTIFPSRHMRRHSRPERCPHCFYRSAHARDLQRHIDAKHLQADSKPKFYCPIAHCDWSVNGTKWFSRKDSCKRHLDRHYKEQLDLNFGNVKNVVSRFGNLGTNFPLTSPSRILSFLRVHCDLLNALTEYS